jgi:Tol biopolymer transport system component
MLLGFLLTGCLPNQTSLDQTIRITITSNGDQSSRQVPAGTTVQGALDMAEIKLDQLDRVDPPGYTVLTDGQAINIIRVREEFQVEDIVLPFESQTVQNESLPDQREMIIQTGENGALQRTYRIVFENGQEVSRQIFKETRLVEPKAEIKMVGVQKPFTPYPLPGRLVYLAGGNAWVMENNTGDRRPVVTTADLDGRVFSLSPDGKWLLFTRKSTRPVSEEINTLWIINLEGENEKPVDLRAANVVHFADWVPGRGLTITYSTVEPRSTPPGWQSNNDLYLTSYSPSGMILETEKIIESNYGGAFGWWGTTFAWSPDGAALAYAQPDAIGLVDFEKKQQRPLVDITSYQTRADWAWVTGLGWSPDHKILYYNSHIPKPGTDNLEGSPYFDLAAVIVDGGPTIPLAEKTGMFGYPVPSPVQEDGGFQVAFLQNTSREQGDTGRYWLDVMDRDGSNLVRVFPEEGKLGLEPQRVVWSPQPVEKQGFWLACIYQGNLILVDPATGSSRQITGDGLIDKIDW